MTDFDINKRGWVLVPVDRLVKAVWNYKPDDAEKQAKLEANIKRNGQIENLIVRILETGFLEVANGNHRLDAFVKLGITEAMVYNLGAVSQAHAERVAVETNETRFASDNVKLGKLLKEISLEFPKEELVQTMPYSAEELDNFIKMADFDFNSLNPTPDPSGAGGGGSDEDWRTVTLRLPEGVADQLEDQIDRFKRHMNPGVDDLSTVSPVMAVEAMVQHLAQIPTEQLV
jgi:hypothetical protein